MPPNNQACTGQKGRPGFNGRWFLSQRKRLLWALVLLLGLLVLGPEWGRVAQVGEIQLLLQDPLEFDSPADRCSPMLCQPLVRLIDGAEARIDAAMYGSRDQSAILDALLRAKARGVTIRAYVDRDEHGHNIYHSTDDWAERIGNVRDDQERETRCRDEIVEIPLTCALPDGFDGPRQCSAYRVGEHLILAPHASREPFGILNQIMHHKFVVVDGLHVWTGSANLSDSGTGGYNANAVALIRSVEVANEYTREFEALWARADSTCDKAPSAIKSISVGADEVSVRFSPQDRAASRGVATLLAKARQRINVAVFFLTSKQLTADLIAAHERGVDVRVILDATAAKNGYTKHEVLREAGIPVRVESWGGKMHMKAASIDGAYVAMGSMNWTSAGEWANDENTLLIRSQRSARQFDDYFEQLWVSIPARWQEQGARPDPESVDSGTACFDGADNDFDDQIDADDPGCGPSPPKLPGLPPHKVVEAVRLDQLRDRFRLAWPTFCRWNTGAWYECVRE